MGRKAFHGGSSSRRWRRWLRHRRRPRGPLIYCLEEIDQPSGTVLSDVAIHSGGRAADAFQPEFRSDLLGGMVVLHHTGVVYERGGAENALYSRYSESRKTRKVALTFIPHYAWANRQASSMQVWNLVQT
ncbi:MAG TPA: hypothetical protein VMG31_16150 [Verrucomicrobiae bacterium]|nr:hypothetical protein [Verrucomicrobiae bacterium]